MDLEGVTEAAEEAVVYRSHAGACFLVGERIHFHPLGKMVADYQGVFGAVCRDWKAGQDVHGDKIYGNACYDVPHVAMRSQLSPLRPCTLCTLPAPLSYVTIKAHPVIMGLKLYACPHGA